MLAAEPALQPISGIFTHTQCVLVPSSLFLPLISVPPCPRLTRTHQPTVVHHPVPSVSQVLLPSSAPFLRAAFLLSPSVSSFPVSTDRPTDRHSQNTHINRLATVGQLDSSACRDTCSQASLIESTIRNRIEEMAQCLKTPSCSSRDGCSSQHMPGGSPPPVTLLWPHQAARHTPINTYTFKDVF